MKSTIFSVLFLCIFVLVSCIDKKEKEQKVCTIDECYICDKMNYFGKEDSKDIDKLTKQQFADQYKKIIVKPLVKEESCGYIVSGTIKYIDNCSGQTAALVDYGDGVVDAWAVKSIYYHDNKKCGFSLGKHQNNTYTKCCKFEQECVTKADAATTKQANQRATPLNH